MLHVRPVLGPLAQVLHSTSVVHATSPGGELRGTQTPFSAGFGLVTKPSTSAQLPSGGLFEQPLQSFEFAQVAPSVAPPTHFFVPPHVPPAGQSEAKAHEVDGALLQVPRHALVDPPGGWMTTLRIMGLSLGPAVLVGELVGVVSGGVFVAVDCGVFVLVGVLTGVFVFVAVASTAGVVGVGAGFVGVDVGAGFVGVTEGSCVVAVAVGVLQITRGQLPLSGSEKQAPASSTSCSLTDPLQSWSHAVQVETFNEPA